MMITQIRNIAVFILTAFLFSCDLLKEPNDGTENGPVSEWESLHFEDKRPTIMKLYRPYLYVGTRYHGLWRLKIETDDLHWEHLGPEFQGYGGGSNLQGIDVYDGVITVGFVNPVRKNDDTGIGIWRSYDDGLTWEPADSGMYYNERRWSASNDIARSHFNSDILLAGNYFRRYRSVDGGMSWIDKVEALTTYRFTWHPSEPDIVFKHGEGTWGSYLRLSMDKGITWQLVPTIGGHLSFLNYIAFDGSDHDIMYFTLGRHGLYKIDRGLEYLLNPDVPPETVIDITVHSVVTNPLQAGVFFAGCGIDYLCVSYDYGKTIYQTPLPEGDELEIITMVYDELTNTLYVGRFGGGIYRLNYPFNAELTLYQQE